MHFPKHVNMKHWEKKVQKSLSIYSLMLLCQIYKNVWHGQIFLGKVDNNETKFVYILEFGQENCTFRLKQSKLLFLLIIFVRVQFWLSSNLSFLNFQHGRLVIYQKIGKKNTQRIILFMMKPPMYFILAKNGKKESRQNGFCNQWSEITSN